jgi:protein-S-isoprenylcysteine O-methyltransferase Ste14
LAGQKETDRRREILNNRRPEPTKPRDAGLCLQIMHDMELLGKTPINPILFFSGKIAGYLTWMILLFCLLGIPVFPSQPNMPVKYISYIALTVGLFLTIISLVNLGKSTRLGLPQKQTDFKTGGIYRFSRNPMYLGFDLLTAASALYSLNTIIILMGLYSIAVYHLIILAEENFLEQRFGSAYAEYKNKVRRYL